MTKMPPRKAAMKPEALQKLMDNHLPKLNQTTTAALLGVDRRTVIRWLDGTTPISAASAALIRFKLA